MIEPTDEMIAATDLAMEKTPGNLWTRQRAAVAAVLAIVERDYPIARPRIPLGNRNRYAASAAPESIAVYLRRARIAAQAAQREVKWLSDLLERRTAEKDAGEWP